MHPDRVGPYVVDEKIGAGGMGTVYRAHHPETSDVVAVKVLPANLARTPGFAARFSREVEALGQLTHPNVVRLLDSGEDDGMPYYVMEFVEGENLGERLRREKRLPWRDAVDVAVQTCSALRSAHAAGIVHRDLKPSNLMLQPEGQVKLTDFGVAQLFAGTRLTETGNVIGTAEYMSPEQAEGRRTTRKSDLYSLGALLYVMLTGRPPFTGQSTVDILQKHRYGLFDSPKKVVPEIPSWLDELVCQLLEKDPDDRPPDAHVVSRRLQEVVAKVDYALEQETAERRGVDTNSPTVIASAERGPGSATLMRDLVKAEVAREHAPSAVGRFFDNTWVLITLLALLIVGGVWWFRSRGLTPEERFDAGVELLEEPAGSGWIRAREEYFEPLVESDPERWAEEVEPYLEQIERYEFRARLERGRGLSRSGTPDDEAERFLQLAVHHQAAGDYAEAERILAALVTLLEGRPEQGELREKVQGYLEDLRSARREGQEEDGLLQASVERVRSLVEAGEREEAAALVESIENLYGTDPAARSLVDRARAILEQEAESPAGP